MSRLPAGLLVRLLVAAAIALLGLSAAACSAERSSAATSASVGATDSPGTTSATSAQSSVPAHVRATLKLIDAGKWPPADGSGTRGGTRFGNREALLPATAGGKRVSYTEWDVNRKRSGHTRDAERIITGSDGSAWYTDDHYESFTRIR